MSKAHAVRQWILIGLLGGAVAASAAAISQRSNDYAFFDPLIDVKAMIDQLYVEEFDRDKLQEGAIRGMLDVLGDPYTQYIPPSEASSFNEQISGEYVGIGAEVILKDGWITIVTPLDDSPAFAAGLMADDRIVAIDGKTTENEPIDASIARMKGEPGTEVVLTIERDGKQQEITVVRNHIRNRPVRGFHRLNEEDGRWQYLVDPARDLAYLRLSQFTEGAAQDVERALRDLGAFEGGLNGLVLDLRWNPGGLLSEAIAISDLFLESGPIVSTRTGGGRETVAEARARGTLPPMPVVILINGQSASASEVLAGALTENPSFRDADGEPLAIALGTRTFGKGSVQTVRPLESQPGAILKITEQKYYLPSGRSLHRLDDSTEWGVDPSPGFFVEMTTEQTREMLEARRRQSILRRGGPADDPAVWSNAESILGALKDPQLTAAVHALQARVETGAWSPVSEADPSVDASQLAELRRANDVRERLLRELDRLERRIAAISQGVAPEDRGVGFDLWPDETPIAGGTLIVRDAEGNEVTRLKITNDNLERWLIDAGVEKQD